MSRRTPPVPLSTQQQAFLTKDELHQLTGKRNSNAQATALRAMGIDFILRPDGLPIVSRARLENMLGVADNKTDKRKTEPNWETR